MSYDKVLQSAGDFGLYQKLLCGIFVFYTTFLCGINYYTQIFIFDTPDHRCQLPEIENYVTQSSATWKDILPWVPRNQGYPSKCSKTAPLNATEFAEESFSYFTNLEYKLTNPDEFSKIQRSAISFVENSPQQACEEDWSYNHDLVFPTIISQNDWVCDDDWKPTFIHTTFWIGNTVGCFVWGFTNDKLGRKPTVLLSHLVYSFFGFATLFSQDFIYLCICRFFVGCAHHTVSHLPYLLVIEYCGVESRIYPLLMVMVSYSVASMTIPWVAMFLPSWNYLAIIAPTAILPVLLAYKWIPESPSWLIVVGKSEKAVEVLKNVAKVNNQNFDSKKHEDELLKEREAEQSHLKKESIINIFVTPNLRKNAFLVNVICMMGFMCYYGHVQNTSNLGEGNVYKSYFLGSIVEVPCWSIPFIINKFGRRWPLIILFFVSGVCGTSYGLISDEWYYTSLTIALIGRMTVTAAYFICLQYGSEIFPTKIRGQGVAMCEILGGIAIFLSPSIVYLAKVSPILPLLILGMCSLLGAVAAFGLPETAGCSLPQTLQEAREFGKNQSYFDCFCVKKNNRSSIETKEENLTFLQNS